MPAGSPLNVAKNPRFGDRLQMPNTEDYTLLWIGVRVDLDSPEAPDRGHHPLVVAAKSAHLDHWVDVYNHTVLGEPIYTILVGEKVDLLGYKEGRSNRSLSKTELVERLERVEAQLAKARIEAPGAQLHVLLHFEE
jgi:hypothetical protein